jgi:hypothetical protein
MKDIKDGYKVVRLNAEEQKLSFSSYSCAEVRYCENEWASPRRGCGPLAVFDNITNALNFIEYQLVPWKTLKIYKCKYVASNEKSLWFTWPGPPAMPICPRSLSWHRFRSFPEGTVLADKVMITEEVKE